MMLGACTLGYAVGYDRFDNLKAVNDWTRGYICVGCGHGPVSFGIQSNAVKYRLCICCYLEAEEMQRLCHMRQYALPERPHNTPARCNAKVHRHVTRGIRIRRKLSRKTHS